MGELTRNYAWSESILGVPELWPQSLKTTISIILNSKFPMFLFWGEEHLCFYNDAYRPSLGNEGKHPWALGKSGESVWPEIWKDIKPLIDQVLSGGEATWSEDQLLPIYRNGKLEDVYWTYSYSPVCDESGHPAGVFVTCRETTEKVISMKVLDEAHRQFRNLVMQAPVPIVVLKGENFITEIANDAYLPLVGKTAEEFLHKPLFESLPEIREFIEPIAKQVVATGKAYTGKEFPLLINRNGKEELCYFDFIYEPLSDHTGINGLMAVAHEVTERVIDRKRVEESEALLQQKVKERTADLEKQKELVDNILKNSSNGISVTEVIRNEQGEIIDGKTILANDAAVRFTGLPKELYLTKKATELDPDIIHSEYFRTCIKTLETGEPSLIQYYLEPTGRWLELTVSRMDNDHLIHIFTDITPIKESQLKLERMVEDLKRSNQNLEDFAYAASHDLKEPVRKVHFFSERIKEKLSDRMTEEEKRYFERMQFASNRMSNLIDDLLTYSQISVKPKKFEAVDLNHLMQLVLSDLDLEIEDKNASIQVKDLFTIQGHHRQLQQAFHNLVSNALKYHKEGSSPEIEISGSKVSGRNTGLPLTPEQLNSEYFLVTVRDKGIGFEQKDAERIFNIFTRLHGNNEYKGSGVGLSIVKKVMENHYGFVLAEGKPGEGSIFKLYFPVMHAQDSF